jgi:hypothetical protein
VMYVPPMTELAAGHFSSIGVLVALGKLPSTIRGLYIRKGEYRLAILNVRDSYLTHKQTMKKLIRADQSGLMVRIVT